MSRIGKQTIEIPEGVDVRMSAPVLHVKGPKGELERIIPAGVHIEVQEKEVKVSVENEDDKAMRALWGTYASHVCNMIEGVSKGFQKQLEVNGVGYRVAMQGTDVKLEVGFSHPVIYKVPPQVKVSVEKNLITLLSFDKEVLGQTAAEIRAIKKPEPYKGKGIKYVEEVVRRKAGKAAKAAE